MTPSPECATVETTILDALHIMHDGKFLHLPVLDKGEGNIVSPELCYCIGLFHDICCTDGYVVACVDVLQITHASISMVFHLY